MLKAYACAPGGRLTYLDLHTQPGAVPQALWFDL